MDDLDGSFQTKKTLEVGSFCIFFGVWSLRLGWLIRRRQLIEASTVSQNRYYRLQPEHQVRGHDETSSYTYLFSGSFSTEASLALCTWQ